VGRRATQQRGEEGRVFFIRYEEGQDRGIGDAQPLSLSVSVSACLALSSRGQGARVSEWPVRVVVR
jgi:hypothetical protein